MSDTPAPGDAARAEAAAQAVAIAAMVIVIPVAAWLQRHSTDADALRTLRMRAARLAERHAARAAAGCWRLAERARRAYEADAA